VIQTLCGITDDMLKDAPPLEAVAADFEMFMAGSILVGHNVCGFDLPVLDAQGIRHPAEAYDTQRIASMLLPALGQYGLVDATEHFGIDLPVHHRALPDAEAARAVLLALLERSGELPSEVLGQIAQWLTPTAYPWRGFFREAWEMSAGVPQMRRPMIREPNGRELRSLKPRAQAIQITVQEPACILASAANRPDVFSEFDERPEQKRMLEAVTEAVNNEQRLMVEAGTGTGKSMAYLIPAACESLANDSRVVVSTSTINLQEQLTKKDVPALQALMTGRGLMACQLKGRRNYLCLRRFQALRSEASLSDEEAQLASRILVWLGETETGDRSELRLSQEEEVIWARISADRAECTSDNSPFVVDGSCFLQRARKKAEASHIVVVNHALLLSDIATGGRVIPPYQHLVVDEAHHLEDEATRQFGFSIRGRDLDSLLDRCDAIAPELERALRTAPVMLDARRELAALAGHVKEGTLAARPRVGEALQALAAFLSEHSAPGDEPKLHLTRAMRVQPDWTDVEIGWDNCKATLGQLAQCLGRLQEQLSEAEELGMLNQELVVGDVGRCLEDVQRCADGIAAGIEIDDPQRVVWLEADRQDGGIILSWVPLDVHALLRDGLYADRKSVVLTGATLRTQGGFAYLQQRLGLEECETVGLGSPFDYRHAALVLLPRDMPEPNSPIYTDHLAQAVIELARASRGRTLVLFTSHSMLRAVKDIVGGPLRNDGIEALAQGVDGSPRQLVRALMANPQTVLLGTSSFWEGVDIPGEALSLIVMARLPFAVPTDPVYAARAAMYEDAFNQYMLPQAVIRFKQGFGRLIRTKTDRGVLVVLDQRIAAKEYGRAFLQSLPPAGIRQVSVRQMPDLVEGWLASPTAAK
jgi:DNA polymerase-3 subunit epsilon/ATP-dependent DNA helicase DinG